MIQRTQLSINSCTMVFHWIGTGPLLADMFHTCTIPNRLLRESVSLRTALVDKVHFPNTECPPYTSNAQNISHRWVHMDCMAVISSNRQMMNNQRHWPSLRLPSSTLPKIMGIGTIPILQFTSRLFIGSPCWGRLISEELRCPACYLVMKRHSIDSNH
jgi:hypothetical protein